MLVIHMNMYRKNTRAHKNKNTSQIFFKLRWRKTPWSISGLYTCTYTHTHSPHTHMYTIHTCVYIYTHTYMYTHRHTIHTETHTSTLNTHSPTHTQTHTSTWYIHTHTRIYRQTHRQTLTHNAEREEKGPSQYYQQAFKLTPKKLKLQEVEGLLSKPSLHQQKKKGSPVAAQWA